MSECTSVCMEPKSCQRLSAKTSSSSTRGLKSCHRDELGADKLQIRVGDEVEDEAAAEAGELQVGGKERRGISTTVHFQHPWRQCGAVDVVGGVRAVVEGAQMDPWYPNAMLVTKQQQQQAVHLVLRVMQVQAPSLHIRSRTRIPHHRKQPSITGCTRQQVARPVPSLTPRGIGDRTRLKLEVSTATW
jgi:hypothetical protein